MIFFLYCLAWPSMILVGTLTLLLTWLVRPNCSAGKFGVTLYTANVDWCAVVQPQIGFHVLFVSSMLFRWKTFFEIRNSFRLDEFQSINGQRQTIKTSSIYCFLLSNFFANYCLKNGDPSIKMNNSFPPVSASREVLPILISCTHLKERKYLLNLALSREQFHQRSFQL
jgi:hypothetical protein